METRTRSISNVAIVALAALLIAYFFVSTYLAHQFPVPLGWDTVGYTWRTALARSSGIASLPFSVPPPGPVNPGRPAFPVVAALLTTLGGGSALRVAEILPGVMSAATGLAAGAFVSCVLKRSVWVLAAVAVAIGASVSLVHVLNVEQYQDQAIATAVFMAGAVPLTICVWDRSGVVGAVLLLGALGTIHWSFFEMATLVVGLTGVVFVPNSYRKWRGGISPLWATPSMLMLLAAIGGGLLAGVWILGVLGASLPHATLDADQLTAKPHRDLPAYHLPIFLGAAAVGAIVLGIRSEKEDEEGTRSRVVLAFTSRGVR